MNNATIIGHVGNDPQVTYTATEMAVLRLRVATSTRWVDDEGEQRERSDWHHVTIFGPRGIGIAKHVQKGDKVGVSGELRTHGYTDKKGVKRVRCEIVCDRFEFCGGRRDRGPAENEPVDAKGRNIRGTDDAAAAAPKAAAKKSKKAPPAARESWPTDADDDIPE